MSSGGTRAIGGAIIALCLVLPGAPATALQGTSALDQARRMQLVRVVEGVTAAFQTFIEARGRLPGDTNGDGIIGPPDTGSAVLEMVGEGYLDASGVDRRAGALRLPGNLLGTIGTARGVADFDGDGRPDALRHTLRIPTEDPAMQARLDEILDDGATTTGHVQVERVADGPDLVHVALD